MALVVNRLATVRDAVYKHFLDEFPGDDGARVAAACEVDSDPTESVIDLETRLLYGGEVKDQPEDDGKPWIRLTLRHTGREQESLGPVGRRRFRNEASIFATVYVPFTAEDLTKGHLPIVDVYGEAFKAVFNGRRIIYSITRVNKEGVEEEAERAVLTTLASIPQDAAPDGKWLPFTVETPLVYDEIA